MPEGSALLVIKAGSSLEDSVSHTLAGTLESVPTHSHLFLLLRSDRIRSPGSILSTWLRGCGLILSGSECIISKPLASCAAASLKSVSSREIPLPFRVPGSALPLF